MFGHDNSTASTETPSTMAHAACPSPVGYLDAINACGTAESPEEVTDRHSDGVLRPMFSRLLCVPASSAPVFSQSGLIA